MISTCTSMGDTLYQIASKAKLRSLSENNSPPYSFSPNQTQRKTQNTKAKTITSNFNFSSIIDLMKQSKLKKDSRLLFNKSYYINLLKIKLKKKIILNKFPPIKTFSPIETHSTINYNALHSLTTPNFAKNKHLNTFSYNNKKHNQKINIRYKDIINQNPPNLKVVYVNKLFGSKNKNSETEENIKINDKIKVKNKIEENNFNFNISTIRFMAYHGFNKKIRDKIRKYNSIDKCSNNKYAGLNNKKIRQFFLKKKLNQVNSKMNFVLKDVEDTKSKINNLYTFLNKDIQYNLEEEYKHS